MAIYFSDLYVNTVSKGILVPGEQLVARASATHVPWWSMGIPMLASQYLMLATTQRVVLVRHRRGWLTGDRMEEVKAVPWNQVERAQLKGFLSKKLTLKGGEVDVSLSMRAGFFEVPKNIEGAKALVDTWQKAKALPSGGATYALHA